MFWLIVSICLGATGQIFFKLAAGSIRSDAPMSNYYFALAMNSHLWMGMVCYCLSLLIWFRVLLKFDLSFAYPMVGLGYVITALLAIYFLGEKITLLRWAGILVTVAGIILLNFSREV
jgi:multidrug transporter EmrE-like cation transporter